MNIRQMTVEDIAAVAAIEASASSPWSKEQVASELHRKTGIALVAMAPNGGVAAWCCGLQAGADAELLKITVNPSKRRLGHGEALLQKLYAHCVAEGAEQIFLEVRSRNIPALQLYAKQGFQEGGRRKGYYKEPADDALILVRNLGNDNK
jgi:ribosomal-protein-alanine N-acetyltransferase